MRIAKYLSAFAGASVIFLAGAWLAVSPWVLRLTDANGAWNSATATQFWTGMVVMVVALAALALYAMGLRRELIALGIVVSQPKPAPQAPPQWQAEPAKPAAAAPTPEASPIDDRVLMTLAASLLAEMKHEQEQEQKKDPTMSSGRM
jgi:hypothetical protein